MIRERKLSQLLRQAFFTGGVAVGIGLLAQSVQAQETNDEKPMARVEITGSNIKRTQQEGPASTQILTRKDIQQSGKTTVADVVRSLAADNNGSISGSFTNGFAGSASGVSLRGLSVNSTLVLINGRRTAPYGLGDDGQRSFVDLNTIPLGAVDRIEVLKDGASAIYGSDAIAGVVNIILRETYQGKTISGTLGTSGHGDGTLRTASGTFGFGDLETDKYNYFFSIDAKQSNAIWSRDRPEYLGQADARPWGGRDQRAGATTSSNTGGNSFVGTVRPVSASGSTIPGQGIQNLPGCANIDRGTSINSGGGCLWDPIAYQSVQPETQNINLYGRGTLKISNDMQAYTELGLFNSQAKTITTPSALTSTGFDLINNRVVNTNTGPDQLLLPIGHPDNPFPNNRARPRWVDPNRPRTSDLDTTVTRLLVGVKGTSFGWDYDSGILYAQSKTERTQNGYYRTSALRTAMNNDTFRIGEAGVLNSAQTLGLVSPELKNSATTKLALWDFKGTREFGQLPGGPIGIAVGGEFRHESTDSQATPFTDVSDIVGLGYAAAKASRNISSLYTELALPVIKQLEFQLALRTDQYSDFGNSTTPKIGFKFTPIQQLALRGTYAEGFRAPGPSESGNSAVSGFTTFTRDPIRCPATGLSADCSDGKNVGAVTVGNKNLKPEKSQSYSLGFILEPIKNTSVSVDYWRIVRKNEIVGSDPGAVIANPSGFPDATVVRGEPTSDFPGLAGPIQLVKAPYINAGQTRTSGVDIDLRSRFDLNSYGRMTAGLTLSQMFEFKRTTNGVTQNFVGTHGDTNLSGNGGTPRTRASASLAWDRGPFNLTTTVNYVSGIENKNETGGECLNVDPVTGNALMNCRVASFTTVDLFGRWNVTKQWEVTAAIANLFDRLAPLDVQTYGRINYNPSLHQSGAVGRYFTLGARYTF
ncbi:TonB-dependent receptor [Collimonas sp.]|jgi:iron complex outermembrane receptor protein|uniref:TonB-dependent receptor n=1 Tax=Collimonas sp. TaxID=1963772 RepID=UPI002C685E8B|nr:TonB-dependent receptor [Collimonas sp.]HWW08172.1 TonB-dependent receptor [Collimonas sp.]